jgi:hypothetical protein
MKVLEFIKKNISVLTIFGTIFLLLFSFIFVSNINSPDYHGYTRAFSFIILILGLFILILDFILKQLINDRLYLNLIQTFLFIIILIIFFNLFIQ